MACECDAMACPEQPHRSKHWRHPGVMNDLHDEAIRENRGEVVRYGDKLYTSGGVLSRSIYPKLNANVTTPGAAVTEAGMRKAFDELTRAAGERYAEDAIYDREKAKRSPLTFTAPLRVSDVYVDAGTPLVANFARQLLEPHYYPFGEPEAIAKRVIDCLQRFEAEIRTQVQIDVLQRNVRDYMSGPPAWLVPQAPRKGQHAIIDDEMSVVPPEVWKAAEARVAAATTLDAIGDALKASAGSPYGCSPDCPGCKADRDSGLPDACITGDCDHTDPCNEVATQKRAAAAHADTSGAGNDGAKKPVRRCVAQLPLHPVTLNDDETCCWRCNGTVFEVTP